MLPNVKSTAMIEEQMEKSNVFVSLDQTVQIRSLRQKIDWHILPLMFFTYFLQYLDKVILNYAAIMGLQQNLHMSANQYAWTATAFSIAYTIAEIPQGILIQRLPVAEVLGANIFCWGILICCSAACHDAVSLIALRTVLGLCEAAVAPCLIMITSTFYTKKEAVPRYGIWFSGLGCAQIIGGLISWAAQHGSITGFASWRIMFVSVGAINLVAAIALLVFLPDDLNSAKFLTTEDKSTIAAALAVDQAGSGRKVFKAKYMWEALIDLQTWFLVPIYILTNEPSGVIATFSSTIIRSLGFSSKQSALLGMPNGLVSITCVLVSTFITLTGFPRWLALCILLIPAIVGACLISFLKGRGALAGIYLINAVTAVGPLLNSWVGSNVFTYTKRVTVSAAVYIGFGIGAIIGPQTFRGRDAPAYKPAKYTLIGVLVAALVLTMCLRLLYGARNEKTAAARRAQLAEIEQRGGLDGQDALTRDVTDMRNHAFQYVY